MSILLDLNPTKIQIIKDVCVWEQESLMRIHTETSSLSPRMDSILNQLGINSDEYLDYSSEAFYEFQKVLENPELIKEMPPLFMALFLEIVGPEILQEELLAKYGKDFTTLIQDIENLNDITPDMFSYN
jgi:hypothetical protein